ncbi:MAG: hypothetical protein WAW37_12660 [Syntrophobacteraceae bacterium]
MDEIPCALVKDLRSTGYFYDELKSYSKSLEMDIPSYCKDLAIPYLARISKSHEHSGQPSRNAILKLAIKHLSEAGDEELVDSIFGLKKVAGLELDKVAKVVFQGPFDKAISLSCRHKSESAESLIKLLVNMIRIFKLTEVNAKKSESGEVRDSVGDAIMHSWESSAQPGN